MLDLKTVGLSLAVILLFVQELVEDGGGGDTDLRCMEKIIRRGAILELRRWRKW